MPHVVLPPDSIIAAIHSSVTRVTRRVDIYESDRTTLWAGDVPILEGSIDIDHSRNERRTGNLSICNADCEMTAHPDGLWYDKVIKVYRGVQTPTETWEAQVAEFKIDSISSPHFPLVTTVSCRDHAKTLLESKFAFHTAYPENHPIEEVIRDIAFAGGIPLTQMSLPLTGESLGREYVFDRGAERMAAIKEVATAYGYVVFFHRDGTLMMHEMQDPFTIPPVYTIKTGPDGGNLASYDKEANDTYLKNHIVAHGESASQVPVWAEAENTNPSSPTRISKINRRTDFVESAFIETQAQAQEIADRFLKVAALEQYNVNFTSIVAPYLDVDEIIEFIDPVPGANDPTKYLLQSLSIPLGAGVMSGKAGRVIQIGA